MDAVALRSFEAGHASHLGVTAGDIVVVVDDGRLQKGWRFGLFVLRFC